MNAKETEGESIDQKQNTNQNIKLTFRQTSSLLFLMLQVTASAASEPLAVISANQTEIAIHTAMSICRSMRTYYVF